MPTTSRAARRHSPETLVDAGRVIEVAKRYPQIEVEALAERFGASERTIYNILNAVGIRRSETADRAPARAVIHPWRPAPRRRSPAAIAMSREERQRLVAEFMANNEITKIPTGQMTMSDVTYLDTIHE